MILRDQAVALLVERMYSADPRPAPAVWLGAHEPWWAWEGRADARVLLSARRIEERLSGGRGRLRPADVPVFIDSGAFTEVSNHGRWTWAPEAFVAFIRLVARALGSVEHVGIQDWMCEPEILALTGLDVEEHQRRTVASFLQLRRLAPEIPWVATLQGYTAVDYLRCAQMYADAGVDLEDERLVGVGSVCRRSNTLEIERVLGEVRRGLPARVRLHGYGVKSDSAALACWWMASFDSAAWSALARRLEAKLRRALGLPCKGPRAQVLAATDEQLAAVDLDLVDFLEWKRERCPASAAASQEFAEVWRARQIATLAAAIVDRLQASGTVRDADELLAGAAPVGAEQLDMFQGAA